MGTLSLKLAVLSATVVSTAVMFSLSSPFFINFTVSDIPVIWTNLISWLKPPYLYVVINCIIITIVASSRLQSKVDDDTFTPPTHHSMPIKPLLPALDLPPIHEPVLSFHGGVLDKQPEHIDVASGYNNIIDPNLNSTFTEPQFSLDEDMKIAKKAYEEIKKNKVNKPVISMANSTPSDIYQFPMEKPPASARFNHRKPAKPAPEGGRTLGVAKPKKQDTLESTWKAITEGRSVPLTRHLRKSDTWETHGQRHENRNSTDSQDHTQRMTKSDTFSCTATNLKKPPVPASKLSRSDGSGRLKKEPSLGQEELNRKVEAFIKKFNEDMRLQRQESLNQYMEMINRGAH
ncbi:hypothetical protein QVD17_05391 [Tagetes erecta]|uniref:DUF4408 domain-containing protein n=1 Tax=Tagetes erecta TaxID=13708 RepID=A0AAD8LIH3_TARER|nr:hypothetical protein QVD17_05391 [Tagetes erecta]